MTVVAGAAAHGSPGVSTALHLVASLWSGDASVPVVVECDAAGGVLAARYELSLNPGFVTLAESLRKFEAPALLDHAQRMPSGVACVPISPSSTAASAQLRSAGPYLGPYLAGSGHPVMVDAGTVVPDGKVVPTLISADLLLWFVRPTREELLVLRHRLAECQQPENVAVVLVGSTPYDAEQVATALAVEVLHTLPVDRRAATAATQGGDDRYLRRSQLARSCGRLAELIQQRIARVAEVAPPPPPSVDEGPPLAAEVVAPPPPPPPAAEVDEDPPLAAEVVAPPPPPPSAAEVDEDPPMAAEVVAAPPPPPPSAAVEVDDDPPLAAQDAALPPPPPPSAAEVDDDPPLPAQDAPQPPPPPPVASPPPPPPSPGVESVIAEFDGTALPDELDSELVVWTDEEETVVPAAVDAELAADHDRNDPVDDIAIWVPDPPS